MKFHYYTCVTSCIWLKSSNCWGRWIFCSCAVQYHIFHALWQQFWCKQQKGTIHFIYVRTKKGIKVDNSYWKWKCLQMDTNKRADKNIETFWRSQRSFVNQKNIIHEHTVTWHRLYCVFTYIYPLLINKDLHECWNFYFYLNFYLCLSTEDLFILW